MLKNSLMRSSLITTYHKHRLIQPVFIQPCISCRKSFPISPYSTRSRTFSIFNFLKALIGPISFISQSLPNPKKAVQDLESQALSTYEKIKLPVTHTFNRIPGFFGRENEIRILKELLSGEPKFLVVNGSKRFGTEDNS